MEKDEASDGPLLERDDEMLIAELMRDTFSPSASQDDDSDDDDDDDDDAKHETKKKKKKQKKMRRLKKKKDKDDDNDADAHVPASDRLRKMFREHSLKRKREESSNDGDSMDAYRLKGFADKEADEAGANVSGSNLGDDYDGDVDEEKKPETKKRRLIKRPESPTRREKEPTTADGLAKSLFPDGDLELEDADDDETPTHPAQQLFDNLADEGDKAAAALGQTKKTKAEKSAPAMVTTTTTTAAVESKLMVHEGWPVIAGDNEELLLRCTYAEMRNGPFRLLSATPAKKSAEGFTPIAATTLQESAWGIFVPHGHRPPRPKQARPKDGDEDDLENEDANGVEEAAAAAARGDDLDGGGDQIDADCGNDDDGGSVFIHSAAGNERPWFLVVSEPALLKTLASPLFTHRVRLVRVNPEQVVFTYKTTVPIYYAYDLMEKRGLWAANANHAWTPVHLSRIAVDTLYIHMELYDAASRSNQLEHVLSSVKGFPLHSDPANKMLPLDHVSLNDYSTRKDRSALLRTKFTSLVKLRDKAVASIGGLPMVYCRDLMACELRCKSFLFTDMEKPASAWLLLERGVPYSSLGSLTVWTEPNHQLIKTRYAATRPLYETNLGKVVANDLKALGAKMRLDPMWFADWFGGLETKELMALFASDYTDALTPEKRMHELKLEFYSIFCASYFWHSYHEKRAKYNASYSYIFTKDVCEDLFRRGWQLVSQVTRTNLLLGNAPDRESGKYQVTELDHGDQYEVRLKTRNVLKIMSEKQAKGSDLEKGGTGMTIAPPVLVEACSSWALVNLSVTQRVQNMKKFIMEVAMRWAATKRAGVFTEPLSLLPPLTIQSAYLYGPSTVGKPDSVYRSLIDAVAAAHGDKRIVMIIRAGDDPSRIFSVLKEKLRKIYIIVMDRFHTWSETLMDTVLEVLTTGRTSSECCHIFITAHANTFADMNTSGLVMDDLVDIAQRLQDVLHLGNSGPSSGESYWNASTSRFTKLLDAGSASASLFPMSQRDQQLELNRGCLLNDNSTLTTALTRFASEASMDTEVATERCPILILYALNKTERALSAMLSEHDPTWRSNHVTLVSYETLSRCPSQTAGERRCVIFYDMTYTGAGRPTYMHINAAFERLAAGGKVFVFSAEHIRTVVPEAEPAAARLARAAMMDPSVHSSSSTMLSVEAYKLQANLRALISVYMANDLKTDRLATRNQRLSLLKTAVNTTLANPRMLETLAVTPK